MTQTTGTRDAYLAARCAYAVVRAAIRVANPHRNPDLDVAAAEAAYESALAAYKAAEAKEKR